MSRSSGCVEGETPVPPRDRAPGLLRGGALLLGTLPAPAEGAAGLARLAVLGGDVQHAADLLGLRAEEIAAEAAGVPVAAGVEPAKTSVENGIYYYDDALGRKSWLFCGSDRGGMRAAAMYTLIGTEKLNDVDPQAWLVDARPDRRHAAEPAR